MSVTPQSPREAIDVVLFASPILRVGRWRCPPDHPHFRDSGAAPEALFVFPREGVWIAHEGAAPFVADANVVTYYNPGQRYQRTRISHRGDRCEWFALAPDVLASVLAATEPAAVDRPGRPFPFARGPGDHQSYLRQRQVFTHVRRTPAPDPLFVEETMVAVCREVTRAAYARMGTAPAAVRPGRRDVDLVEAAREVIARHVGRQRSLAGLAAEVGASAFHLARAFRRRTGQSLHGYRTQLRLRAALERMADPRADLMTVALDLGFSSHSHFTATFRGTFGRTPTDLRRLLSR